MPPTTLPMIWLAAVFGVQDAPGGHGTDDPRHADDAQLLIHLDLGERSRVRVVCMRVALFECVELLLHEPIEAAQPHQLCNGNGAGLVLLADDLAAGQLDVFGLSARER